MAIMFIMAKRSQSKTICLKVSGQKAKTDKIDTKMITIYGIKMQKIV
jgi:hypothetical protein